MLSLEQLTLAIQVLEGEVAPDIDATSADAQLRISKQRANVSNTTIAAILSTVPVASPWGPKDEGGSTTFSTSGLPKGGYDAPGSPEEPLDHPLDFNSCGVDCIATLFKLLLLGFDDQDYQRRGVDREVWKATLSPLTKELFALVEQDWNQPDEALNRIKMEFYRACIQVDVEARHQSGITMENLSLSQQYHRNLEFSELFQKLIVDLQPLLGFFNKRYALCSQCLSLTMTLEEDVLDILPFSNAGTSIQGMIQGWFQIRSAALVKQYCPAGHACKNYHNTVANLPELLFLRPQGNKMEGNSTPRRCTFHYWSPKVQAATYGWLGSICHGAHNHWKLYWRHEDPTMVWVYDHLVSSSLVAYPKHNGNIDNGVSPEDWEHGEFVIMERLYQDGLSRSDRLARTIPVEDPIVHPEEMRGLSQAIHQDDTYMYGGIEDMGDEIPVDDDISDEVAKSQENEDMEDVQLEMVGSIHDLMHDPEALHHQVVEGLKQASLAQDFGKEPETLTVVDPSLGQMRNSPPVQNDEGQLFFMSGANAIPIGKRRRRVPAIEASPPDRQDPIASAMHPSLSGSDLYHLPASMDPFGRSAAEIEKHRRGINKLLAETGEGDIPPSRSSRARPMIGTHQLGSRDSEWMSRSFHQRKRIQAEKEELTNISAIESKLTVIQPRAITSENPTTFYPSSSMTIEKHDRKIIGVRQWDDESEDNGQREWVDATRHSQRGGPR